MSGSKNSLRGDNSSLVCVLARNSMAHKLLVGSNGVSRGDAQKVVRHGTIAKVLPYQIGNVDVPLQIVKESPLDPPDENIWLVDKNDTLPVPPVLMNALSAVSQMKRVQIANNTTLCKQLAELRVGSKVFVVPENLSESRLAADAELAVVQYIGPISKGEIAHHYGLVLPQGSKKGNSNGRLHGTQYFTCEPNQGIFVGIDRLRPSPEELSSRNLSTPSPTSYMQNFLESKESSKSKTSSATLVLRVKEKDKMPRYQPLRTEKSELLIDVAAESDHPLKVGDRVVWMSDETGPEIGTVRWIGALNGHRATNPYVGVEFDNAVGCGTGMHNKESLFETKKDHASFIPVNGLMKAEDFYGNTKECEQRRASNNSKQAEKSKQSSTRSDNPSKGSQDSSRLISDPALWSSAVVKLPEYVDNTVKHSTSKPPKRSENNTCRTEFVFKEPTLNVNLTKEKNENATKQKYTKSSNQRILSNLDTSPLLEISPKELFLGNRVSKGEGKPKPLSSQDIQSNSIDLGELTADWVSVPKQLNQEKIRNSATSGPQTGRLNDNDLGLEVFGIGLQNFSTNDADQQELPSSPIRSVSSDGSTNYYDTPDPTLDAAGGPIDLGVGSVVEVSVKDEPHYGVIRWMGTVPEDKKGRRVAGIEMEEEMHGCSDGAFQGRRYFQCNPKKALFTSLNMCRKDGRFQDLHHGAADSKARAVYGGDDDVIPGAVKPPTVLKQEDMDNVCGKYKGIQGHHNSCYLDATLFSMFAFTSCFDSLLFRPQTKNDVPHYEEVQRVLREEIVNPLRKNQFCKWDRVMKLRTLLENHSSVTGLTSEEKDPEEFLTSLVAQILRAKPFLKLSSGQEAYHYQLFVDKDEHLQIPTVQQLFEQSFLASDIKLKEVPSCLIIQMPRFGKSYKMYPRIFPTQLLDVTDIIEDSPRQCTVCGKQAEFECKECFGQGGMGGTLESISFCAKCLDTVHSHKHRSGHRYRRLTVPDEFQILKEHCQIPRLYMQLFAVVCIETSHYVSFVKCGSADAPWCFFDSMADRKGEQNGYNIPEVVSCPDLPYWLTEDGAQSLSAVKDDRQLPEHAKRLLCDAYMCMYQSTDMMMYR